MENATKPVVNYEEVALKLMRNILYSNGMVNRWNPEKIDKWHLKALTEKLKDWVEANTALLPSLIDDDNLLQIADGMEDEVLQNFGHLEGFDELHKALNAYFNGEPTFEQVMSHNPLLDDLLLLWSSLAEKALAATTKMQEIEKNDKTATEKRVATNLQNIILLNTVGTMNSIYALVLKHNKPENALPDAFKYIGDANS